jgi:hypothetical protein
VDPIESGSATQQGPFAAALIFRYKFKQNVTKLSWVKLSWVYLGTRTCTVISQNLILGCLSSWREKKTRCDYLNRTRVCRFCFKFFFHFEAQWAKQDFALFSHAQTKPKVQFFASFRFKFFASFLLPTFLFAPFRKRPNKFPRSLLA